MICTYEVEFFESGIERPVAKAIVWARHEEDAEAVIEDGMAARGFPEGTSYDYWQVAPVRRVPGKQPFRLLTA